jgi:hypothetical protein
MARLDPAIHVFLRGLAAKKTWMPGRRPGKTARRRHVGSLLGPPYKTGF